MKVVSVYLFILVMVMTLADAILDLAAQWPYYPLVYLNIFLLLLAIDVLGESQGLTAIISAGSTFLFQAMWLVYLFAPAVVDEIPNFYPIILGALATAIITYIMVFGRSQMRRTASLTTKGGVS